MPQLKRIVHLKVTSKEGQVLLDDSTLRIDFTVREKVGRAIDTASIRVYNLRPELVAHLTSGKKQDVELSISHALSKRTTTIFTGKAVNIHATSMFEDHITTFYCWAEGMVEAAEHRMSMTWKQSTISSMLSQVIQDINEKAGETIYSSFSITSEAVAKKLETVVNSLTVEAVTHLEAIQKILDEEYLTFSKSGGVLKIYEVPNHVGMEQKLLDSGVPFHSIVDTKLKKPVDFDVATVNISYSLSEYMHPSDLIKLEPSKLQTSLGGYDEVALSIVADITKLVPNTVYFLLEVTHSGSAFTDEWDSLLHGVVYSDGIGGIDV